MTISLPTAMLAKIELARQAEDRTRSEFVRQAIRVYLAQGEHERRLAEVGDDGALGPVKSTKDRI
jgi:metal-responsive CopG/Arc/MetJ family transcriptional regulator